jgi:predicted DNA-binding transcriptional regulator AlpA
MAAKMLSYRQMHEEYGFAVGTLYGMVNRKQIPHVRLSKRWVMFDRDEIESWLGTKKILTDNSRGPRGTGGNHGR